jgi:cyclin-dependent kinase 7
VHAETKRKIAIKKIKLGQFKDGLDPSAIREVKCLQELRHPNVVEVIPGRLAKRVIHFTDNPLDHS